MYENFIPFVCLFGCAGSLLKAQTSVVAESGHYSSLQCTGLSLRWILVSKHRLEERGLQYLQHVGSVVEAHALSCPAACGIFPDQASNPRPLALAGRFSSTVPPKKSFTSF